MLGLVKCPNDISLLRVNQSQAKFKRAVGRNLVQSWMNLTIVVGTVKTFQGGLWSYSIQHYMGFWGSFMKKAKNIP